MNGGAVPRPSHIKIKILNLTFQNFLFFPWKFLNILKKNLFLFIYLHFSARALPTFQVPILVDIFVLSLYIPDLFLSFVLHFHFPDEFSNSVDAICLHDRMKIVCTLTSVSLFLNFHGCLIKSQLTCSIHWWFELIFAILLHRIAICYFLWFSSLPIYSHYSWCSFNKLQLKAILFL